MGSDDNMDSELNDGLKGLDNDHDDASTSSEEDALQLRRNVMNEARFAIRPQDDLPDDKEDYELENLISKKRRRTIPSNADYGDDDDVEQADLNKAAISLASTVNTISQRSLSSKKMKQANTEVQDEENEDRLRRGLDMMESELGGDFHDDDEEDDNMDNELDDGLNDEDENDFYAQIKKKSKQKKEYKKQLYSVAPKYPGMEDEIEGERSVGQMIMKNRGLVAHKAKINRNPRVKKREQYRKAIIRRKGAVRDVRTDEGHRH